MESRRRNFYLIYGAFMLIFALIFVEICSHFFLKYKDYNGDYQNIPRHLFHPYRSHSLNPDYYRPVDSAGAQLHSADGFRSDHPFEKTKEEGVFRIIMMGGSTLYGFGAEAPYQKVSTLQNDETISWFLEQQLNSSLKDSGSKLTVEVINAGVAAYQTFHHLAYFNESLFEYNADMVVFLDGNNDFYFNEPINNWQSFPLGTVNVTEHWNERGLWFTNLSAVRFLAKYSRFFVVIEKFLQQNWQGYTGEVQEPKPIDNTNIAESERIENIFNTTVLKSYVQLNALSEHFDFKMMVFLQPQVVFENSELLSQADRDIQEITLSYDKNKQNKTTIRPELASMFAKNDIPFYDIGEIANAATQNKQLYIDYCHLSPDGSIEVATRMSPLIYDALLKRASQ